MAKKSIWQDENPSGFAFDRPWKWLCLPGVVIQWFLYMFPSSGFARVVSDTRVARSQLMTYYFSAVFYMLVVFMILVLGQNRG